MNEFDLARVWADPANWTLGVLYRASADPRLLVPMRNTNIGWTPNLARARGAIVGLSLFAAAVAPFVTAALAGRLAQPVVALGTAIWFVALFVPVGVMVRRGVE